MLDRGLIVARIWIARWRVPLAERARRTAGRGVTEVARYGTRRPRRRALANGQRSIDMIDSQRVRVTRSLETTLCRVPQAELTRRILRGRYIPVLTREGTALTRCNVRT